MNYWSQQFGSVNIVQAVISICSALIVGYASFLYNKRKYFDQQWWQKKSEKYENVVEIIVELERYYRREVDRVDHGIEVGNYRPYNDLITELEKLILAGSLYFDKLDVNYLENLLDMLKYNESPTSRLDIYACAHESLNVILEYKPIIISNARKNLSTS